MIDTAWSDRVALTFEVGTGTAGGEAARWGQDRWDAGRWSGVDPASWVDRTCDLESFTIDRGRDRLVDPFTASQLQATLNNDDGFWSWHPALPADQQPVDVGRAVRVRWVDLVTGVASPGWYGYVENVDDTYTGAPFVESSLVAFDGFGVLGRAELAPLGAGVGDGETATVRVGRILDAARWPSSQRDLAASTMPLIATVFGVTAAQECQDVADSVGGAVFVDRAGNIAFRGRDWLRTDPAASTVQYRVGNTGAPDVCPVSITLHGINGDGVLNDVQLARTTDTVPAEYVDTVSTGKYKPRSWSRSGLFTKLDTDLSIVGRRVLGYSATPAPRIAAIEIDPVADPSAWPLVLGVDYPWRLAVDYRHPVAGWTWSLDVLVQHVAHTVTPTSWVTTLAVLDAALFPIADSWDNALWDRGKWSSPPAALLEEVSP